jgi:hypothetical protein
MTTGENRPSNANYEMLGHDEAQPDIQPQNWQIADEGAKAYAVDGEELGTVRETLPDCLNIKVHDGWFKDVEMYVPRDLIDRVEGGDVYLRASKDDLNAMDLSTPPALRQG